VKGCGLDSSNPEVGSCEHDTPNEPSDPVKDGQFLD
jgi:hypothetical protein